MLYSLEALPEHPEGLPPGSVVTVQLADNTISIGWSYDKDTDRGLIISDTEHEVHDPRQLEALEEAYDLLSDGVWEYGGELGEELASRIASKLSASWGGDGQTI